MTKINFLDTPGYSDFIGEVKGALRVTDLAVVVLNGVEGFEVGTEQVLEFALAKMPMPLKDAMIEPATQSRMTMELNQSIQTH